MSLNRPIIVALFGIPVSVCLLLFLTTGDARLYYANILPVRPLVLLVLFFMSYLSIVALNLRARRRLSQVGHLLIAHRIVLLPFLILTLVAILWSQMPNAYWDRGIYFMVFPVYSLCTLVLAMSLPFLRVFRDHWRLYLLVALIGLGLSILYDAFDPTIGGLTRRPSGLVGDPNFAAFFLVNLLASVLRYRKIYVADLAIICFTGICTFCTLSREGTLGFALVIIFYVSQVAMAFKSDRIRVLSFRAVVQAALTILILASGSYYAVANLPVLHDKQFEGRVAAFSGERSFAGELERGYAVGADMGFARLDSTGTDPGPWHRIYKLLLFGAS